MAEACLSEPSPSVDHESANERQRRGARTVCEVSEHAALERSRSLLQECDENDTGSQRSDVPAEHHSSCVKAVAWSACPGLRPARVSTSAIAARVPRGAPGSGSPGSVLIRSSERMDGTTPVSMDDHHDAGGVTSVEPTRRRRAVRSVSRTGRRRAAARQPLVVGRPRASWLTPWGQPDGDEVLGESDLRKADQGNLVRLSFFRRRNRRALGPRGEPWPTTAPACRPSRCPIRRAS